MRRLSFVVLLFVVATTMSAQSLSLSGFRLLETDLTAITNGTQEIDQNGEVAALIKVVTSETGFTFDIGMLGVVNVKQAVGEIWVYVPRHAQKISIFHQQYGVIRNFYFPVPIEGGRTYELKLNVEKEQPKIEMADTVSNDYETAYRIYKATAALGDATAQFYVGYFTYNGMGVAQDYNEAVEWYTKAANQGDARAQCYLGICYENGNGVEKDLSKAFYWYTQSAKQNNATAQYNLGDCYYFGKGTKKNQKEAFNWFTKAAEQNHMEAQYMVGNIYLFYYESEKAYKKAIEWLRKAAEQGHFLAQINLGNCYRLGNSVKNIESAQPIISARPRSRYMERGKETETALKWYGKAVEADDTRVWGALGVSLDISNEMLKKIHDSFLSAMQGNAADQYYMGELFCKGEYVVPDYNFSFYWFTKAAEQGHVGAQKRLGECYEKGWGTPKNARKAKAWYNKVSENSI